MMTLNQADSEIPFAQLVQAAAPGSKLLRAWPLTGGISAQMTALELEHPNGRIIRWVVRQPGEDTLRLHPHAAEVEYQLLQLLHARGLAVPAPIYLDPAGAIFSSPVLVLEYIEGRPEFAPADAPDFARQMASRLVHIHRAAGPGADLSFLPPPQAGFRENFGDSHAGAGLLDKEDHLRAVLRAAWPIPPRNPPALLHGDYWPGNVLWRGGRLAAVIDWEDAVLSDPLMDFAITRLDLFWIFNPEIEGAFSRGYLALNPLDDSSLPYWDLSAVLRLARLIGTDPAGWAAFFHPFGRTDISPSSIRTSLNAFAARALDLLHTIHS